MNYCLTILVLVLILSLSVNGQYYPYPYYPQHQVPLYNQEYVNPSANIQRVDPNTEPCVCPCYYRYPYAGIPCITPVAEASNFNQYPVISSKNTNFAPRVDTPVGNNYANVKTDIIDVNPEDFNQYMKSLNTKPVIISTYVDPLQQHTGVPEYIVKTENKKSNSTKPALPISKHEVSYKTFSFNKTYVITPENRNTVVNLSFVNGEPVTEPDKTKKEKLPETTLEPTTTTEENEEPDNIYKFININGKEV